MNTKRRKFELHDCNVEFNVDYDHPDLISNVEDNIYFWDEPHRVISRVKELEIQYDFSSEEAEVHLFLLDAVVKLINLSMDDWALEGLKDIIKEHEGWFPLNGECGITLISCMNFRLDRDDVIYGD